MIIKRVEIPYRRFLGAKLRTLFFSSFTFVLISLTGLSAIAANSPPVITSNGGGVSANVSVAENNTAVTTVSATDPDAGQTLTYSISGGADAARFTINTNTGALAFSPAPNFEAPTDANADNVYVVIVQVSDGNGGTDTQTLNVTVTNVNEPPVITSNGGGVSAAVSVAENTTAVTTVTATDPDVGQTLTYSVNGGADAARFTINASTGVLTFATPPNFEAPTDSDGNNVYVVIVRAADPSSSGNQQTLNVTVTDISNILFIKRVEADMFELSFTGIASAPYALEFTTSLAPPISWQSIITNYSGPAGLWIFTNVSTVPTGFYRTRLIQ